MFFKELNYVSLRSLKPIEEVIEEASAALLDQKRMISDSKIADVLKVIPQAAREENITFQTVYDSTVKKKVKGEKSSQPVWYHLDFLFYDLFSGLLLLGGHISYFLFTKKKVQQQEKKLYQEAKQKHEALKDRLRLEADASPERIEYLKNLYLLLALAMKDLKEDLAA